ncbi:MAG: hypothetical protein ACLPSW_33120 [Roseiarcus sp.]
MALTASIERLAYSWLGAASQEFGSPEGGCAHHFVGEAGAVTNLVPVIDRLGKRRQQPQDLQFVDNALDFGGLHGVPLLDLPVRVAVEELGRGLSRAAGPRASSGW